MKRIYLIVLTVLLLCSCASPTSLEQEMTELKKEYAVFVEETHFDLPDPNDPLRFDNSFLVRDLAKGSVVDANAPAEKSVTLLGKTYTAFYECTTMSGNELQERNVYRTPDYPESGYELHFYKKSGAFCCLFFGENFEEYPRFSEKVTPDLVRNFVSGLLESRPNLSEWENTCKTKYYVKYQLNGEEKEENGAKESFLECAPLPVGAELLEERVSYVFDYDLKLGEFKTYARLQILVGADGSITRMELYEGDTYSGIDVKELESLSALEDFVDRTVNSAYKEKLGLDGYSAEVLYAYLSLDLDGAPYYELQVVIQAGEEQGAVIAKRFYLCEKSLLEAKEESKREYREEHSALEPYSGDYIPT